MRNTPRRNAQQTLCIDLEFSYGKKKVEQIDIYEIGAVLLDADGKEVDSFQTHVKPSGEPCKKTLNFLGIDRSVVMGAPLACDALVALEFFVSKHKKARVNWCSWGDRDYLILKHKLNASKHVDLPTLRSAKYFDAQNEFQYHVPQARFQTSLQEAVEDFCDAYIPNHHSALDDARALSTIVTKFCL
jgi:inhibitor of KinA sporulation pathway (predicted exonuclease)